MALSEAMDTSVLLEKWRHLIEPELLRCATPLAWSELLRMPVTLHARQSSVLLTHDTVLGGERVRSILVACGDLDEVLEMVSDVEKGTAKDGLRRVVFVGRRGWLRALRDYREIAVVCEKAV